MSRAAIVGLLFSVGLFFVHPASAEEKLQFNRDIRPILSNACFHCHGPDEKERKSGLRFDLAEAPFQPAKSGDPAIIKGNAKDSELVYRIFLPDDDDDHMPPIDSGKSLTEEQRETLRKWIDQGAEYQGHWAFLSPERPALPKENVAKHPVDAFLRNRLQAEGLNMRQEADKETLLRRATLDLTGLTDDYCYNITEDPVHVHDLNATIMHLLGVDHKKLIYKFQGRDYRLTDVHGKIVKPILA